MVSAKVLGLRLGFRVRVRVRVSLWVEPYSGLERSHVRVIVGVGISFLYICFVVSIVPRGTYSVACANE